MLWRCEDLTEYNRDYQVEELAPGFYVIGSNGGGEAYAFNLKLLRGERIEHWNHVKVRELIRLIENDGWQHVRTRGSHRQYKHAIKKGRVTVPGHPGDDVHPGTLKSVFKQAGLTEK